MFIIVTLKESLGTHLSVRAKHVEWLHVEQVVAFVSYIFKNRSKVELVLVHVYGSRYRRKNIPSICDP